MRGSLSSHLMVPGAAMGEGRGGEKKEDDSVLDGGIFVLQSYLALAITTGKIGWPGRALWKGVLSRHGLQCRGTGLPLLHRLQCLHTCPGLQAHSPAKVRGGKE